MNANEKAPPPPAGGWKKKLAAGGAAALLLVAGGFAGPLVRNMLPAGGEATMEAGAAEAKDDRPELYTGLHPPLVVNLKDPTGEPHYMQVTMEVMARDQRVIDAVKKHSAAIRNSLILLYGSNVAYATVNTREGKEKMLADALAEIRAIIRERTGEDGVEAVYFTSLIIQ